jgi:hypothetical protein
MRTIRETCVDKTLLRLVDTGKSFVGLAIVGGTEKSRVEGTTVDEAWNRLHAEVGKTNPKYVGYAGLGTASFISSRTASTRMAIRRTNATTR